MAGPMSEEFLGDGARAKAQPHFSGYRVLQMKNWSEETDPYADMMRARVPLQERNEAFAATQANPELASDAEVMLMQGDYGNSGFNSTLYNNRFSEHCLNFWQYVDYFSPWHGAETVGTPTQPDDPIVQDTTGRDFEYGLLNIPNPAYTNAAHKNGVKSIGCIFLPRTGQPSADMLEQDENGGFPVADKLIEIAEYYGFDGYFINQEESIPSENVKIYKQFTKYLIDHGLYLQWYDSLKPSGSLSYQNELNENNATFIQDTEYGLGKVNSSLFVNYDWFRSSGGETKAEKSLQYAADNGIDPFAEVFFGVEANQGKFSGSHGSALHLDYIYQPGTKNLRGSVAVFTPSDYYQRGLDDDLSISAGEIPLFQQKEYQWMIDERERMYFSGVMEDPTDTGKKDGYSREDVGVRNASGWVGVADFASAIKPDLDLYVEAGKQEFLDALAKGEELLASGNAWDDEIKAATDELIEAMSNLRMAPNKDILNDMIAQAGAIDLSVYTADSAAALTNALAEAQAVAANANATQEEVDAAANTLQAAMSGLVFVNGDENNAAEDNTTDNTAADNGTTETTTPAGEGTAPTKTGDAGAAGIAGLALLSAAGALFVLKKKRD